MTLFAAESLETVARLLGLDEPLDVVATRRNVVTRGLDVDALRGRTISLDTGDGPVLLRHEPGVGHGDRAAGRAAGLAADLLAFLAAGTGLSL